MLLHDPQAEALQRLRELIPASCNSACEIVVATGNPVALIVHMARARAVDLIVIGTHGYTGLRHILWGSVAEKVIRLAPCPVLVLRHQEESNQTATATKRYAVACEALAYDCLQCFLPCPVGGQAGRADE
jgi:hypothetical protein